MRDAEALGRTWNTAYEIDALNEWQLRVIRKIMALRGLPQGWNSYGSAPISDETIDEAVRLVGSNIFPPALGAPSVFPLSGGGIQLTWTMGSREVELEVNAERGSEVVVSSGEVVVELPSRRPIEHIPVGRLLSWLVGKQ
jgi:hypothetical protein